MFVFTFVARLFTFQYDRPHFEPLLRLPPNRARTHIESPIMFRVIKLFHVGDSTTKLSACVACASYFQHHGISLFISRHSEGKPSEPPFAEGKSSPAATQQQAVCKKGSPRSAWTRTSQGCAQSRTTDRTSNRRCGSHRTGQLSRPRR